uniref:G protein pathway suppressor 2 n=1 Tax=Chrysemys picta bellii TaxID=8478 RepID=A0A8C3IBM0_CHRPI
MPALLERPKLSSAMARALHRHVMVERERKRQEEEEVDKMMEQKMKEEQERRRKKEMEERMSLEETREQVSGGAGQGRGVRAPPVLWTPPPSPPRFTPGLSAGSPGGHSRAGTLISADRSKQIFAPPVITVSVGGECRCRPGAPGGAGTESPWEPPHQEGPTRPRDVGLLPALWATAGRAPYLGVAMLAGLRGGHLDDLAGTPLEHHEPIFAEGRALHGEGGGSPGVAGLEVQVISHGDRALEELPGGGGGGREETGWVTVSPRDPSGDLGPPHSHIKPGLTDHSPPNLGPTPSHQS